MSGWISVKDRLPELNVDVLVFVNFTVHDVTINHCTVALFNGTCWDADGSYSRDSVTHWMPLPEAPKANDANELYWKRKQISVEEAVDLFPQTPLKDE